MKEEKGDKDKGEDGWVLGRVHRGEEERGGRGIYELEEEKGRKGLRKKDEEGKGRW